MENNNSEKINTQSCQTAVSKSALLSRYFMLENRLETLNKIKECAYEEFKIRRLNKLIFITKRKVRILENHLEHALEAVYAVKLEENFPVLR